MEVSTRTKLSHSVAWFPQIRLNLIKNTSQNIVTALKHCLRRERAVLRNDGFKERASLDIFGY